MGDCSLERNHPRGGVCRCGIGMCYELSMFNMDEDLIVHIRSLTSGG